MCQAASSSSITKAQASQEASQINIDWTSHSQWNHQIGWKNALNNVRLLVQPSLLLWLIFPWLEIFPNSSLLLGLHDLIERINQFPTLPLSG